MALCQSRRGRALARVILTAGLVPIAAALLFAQPLQSLARAHFVLGLIAAEVRFVQQVQSRARARFGSARQGEIRRRAPRWAGVRLGVRMGAREGAQAGGLVANAAGQRVCYFLGRPGVVACRGRHEQVRALVGGQWWLTAQRKLLRWRWVVRGQDRRVRGRRMPTRPRSRGCLHSSA